MTDPNNKLTATSFSIPADADLVEHPRLSGMAVLGLLLGLASSLALISRLFWIVPAAGVVVSGLALRTIRIGDPPRVGRTAAWIGVVLCLLFGAAAPTADVAHRWMLRREAQQWSLRWFELLAHDGPQKAVQLTFTYVSRQPLDDSLWQYYRLIPAARGRLQQFVDDPLVRRLLALGTKAHVRYWCTEREVRLRGTLLAPKAEKVTQVYAVTYGEGDTKTTFFVR
ncbi:MAG: hypothetical protein ACC645_10420, partial [Pirellulales bacterium]